MIKFMKILLDRNILLFNFGLLNLIAALVLLLLMQFYFNQGTTNFLKPLKFALSIAIFSWTMGWYAFELKDQPSVYIYSWVVVITLGFEILYISFQAARGQMSHFNTSSPFYFAMTIMMGIVAVILTLWTLYIGILFFTSAVRPLPDYYLWAIRTGIILFVIFAMEGGLMGARFSHSVGEPQKGAAIPLLGWNTRIGDLRVAHFIGMHALQVIPLFSWYVFKNKSATLALACVYAILATFTFFQALQGKPFFQIQLKQLLIKT
ncbi:hypothetical protein G6M26_27225 [Agrobacterium tumefaciens]|nr:hypothetical protein [Agrobacterium tumefaciens]NTE22247.1 hypothetical protein [Agrobacterium tumefaciens]